MRYDGEDLYWACFVLFIVGFLIVGPAIGSIVAARDNNTTIEVCKELCATYDKRPQCAVCCEMIDWQYEDRRYSNGCY